jgi:acyl-CoA thioesterase-1
LPYSREFSNLYSELANKHQSSLVPFLLTNVAGKPELNQDDGIHPTANAQPILLDNVWPILKPLLKK